MLPQGRSLDKSHGDETLSLGLADLIDGADIGMVERRGGFGFVDETLLFFLRLAEMLPASSIVIASDYVADEVRPMLQPDQELITLDYTVLDEGAISLLRPLVTDEILS